MAANKTVETDGDVTAFLDKVADPMQRADADTLITMMATASGHPPKMWGPSIIGFGSYNYKYDSGRQGTSLRIGFSPRKGQTVLYIVDGFPEPADLLAKLGKHKIGKACLYIKRLADVDENILRQLVDASLAEMDRGYPQS